MIRPRTRKMNSGLMEPGRIEWQHSKTQPPAVGSGIRTTPLFTKETQDTVGSPDTDNVFISSGTNIVARAINGTSGAYTYKGVGPAICRVRPTLPPAPTLNALRVEAISKSNPSRPVADMVVYGAELRELPSLVRMAGNTLLRRGSGAFLAYQFGWKPLIGDYFELLRFQSHVAKRQTELSRLYSNNGLKRRVELQSHTAKQLVQAFPLCSSLGPLLTGDGMAHASRRSWATLRYRPFPGSIPPSVDADLHKLAYKAAYGLTVDASTFWNLIPWSWLVDWFGNVGDFLESTRNVVGAELVSCCVMTHTSYSVSITDVNGRPGVSGGGHTTKSWTKTRYPGTMTLPELNLGAAIGLRQTSILGALGVNKIPKRLLR